MITFTGSPTRTITYTYDAAGTKLKMAYNDGTTTTVIDYAGGFVYNDNALSFFPSPEGRVVKNGSNYEYQYSIADHQGNTRVVFTSADPVADPVTATFESGTQTAEQADFQNYPTGGNRSSLALFDHTDAGTTYTYSQLLNGGNGSQVGLAKSYKVFPGDTVKIAAYAKYWNETSTTSNLSGFAAALAGAFGVSSGSTGEALKAFTGLDNYGGVVAAGGGSGSSSAPKAFVNILIFDKDYKFLDIAAEQISTDAEQVGVSPVVAHELLESEYAIKEAGYAYIYVSNENATQVDVYFDDITMTHTPGRVIQSNEYYPFGLQTANSWTRESSKNDYLYNAGSELNANSGWYEMFYRGYDPALGRMLQVDPMASSFTSVSPYNYSFNDPVFFNDPSGASPNNGIPLETSNAEGPQGGGGGGGGGFFGFGGHLGFVSFGGGFGYREGGYVGSGNFGGFGGGINKGFTIDFRKLADGNHLFTFTNGQLTNYSHKNADGDLLASYNLVNGVVIHGYLLNVKSPAGSSTRWVEEEQQTGSFNLVDGIVKINGITSTYAQYNTGTGAGTIYQVLPNGGGVAVSDFDYRTNLTENVRHFESVELGLGNRFDENDGWKIPNWLAKAYAGDEFTEAFGANTNAFWQLLSMGKGGIYYLGSSTGVYDNREYDISTYRFSATYSIFVGQSHPPVQVGLYFDVNQYKPN